MSTTTPRRPSPARGQGSAKSKSRSTGGRGTKPSSRRAHARRPKRTGPALGARAGTHLWSLISDHRRDIASISLIVLGVTVGLGTYLGAAGPLGELLDTALGITVGMLRYIAAPLLIAAGLVLLGGGRDEDDGNRVRVVLGVFLLLIAVTGLLHVTRYQASEGDPAKALGHAGGAVGLAAGRLLQAGAGTAGAVLVLLAVVVFGLLVVTGGSMRSVRDRTATVAVPVFSALVRGVQRLFAAPAGLADGGGDGDDDAGDGHDPNELATPTPRRSRRKDKATPDVVADDVDPTAVDATVADLPAPAPAAPFVGAAHTVAVEVPAPPRTLELEDYGPADRPTPAEGVTWTLPPAKLLGLSGNQEVDRGLVERTGRTLEHAMASHGVETRLVGMVVGPTVTRYELELGPGVKVARVTSLHKDIAYAMATPDVRIIAPIPGRQAIGIEVPNPHRQLVTLGDILASEEARHAEHPLEVAIGRDIAGRSVLMNLGAMPHLLIAGATGAGKSSCINSLITTILMRCTPDEVRMILIDPKQVELGQYNRLPHLLTQVVTDPKKAANALNWATKEMDRRYELLSEVGVRDLKGYNEAFDRGDLTGEESRVLRRVLGPNSHDVSFPRLPYVLVVVDELNDLMMVAARDVEDSIMRIAQKARAVGIHLVVATQRPSVNVITGVIKANIPAKLAFAVSSQTDSRVILDQVGAERLVGKGDMLMLSPTSSAPMRIQGSWVGEDEVRAVAAHWRRQAPEPTYVEGVEGADGDDMSLFDGGGHQGSGDEDDAQLMAQARELVVRSQLGSTSMLQRKLRVGFARAGRLMDLLEQQGVVGPSTGSKAREVLMTPEELDARSGASSPS